MNDEVHVTNGIGIRRLTKKRDTHQVELIKI